MRVLTSDDLTSIENRITRLQIGTIAVCISQCLVVLAICLQLFYRPASMQLPSAGTGPSLTVEQPCSTIFDQDMQSWCHGIQTTLALEKSNNVLKLVRVVPTETEANKPDSAWLDKQINCLALNIYHEGRSEFNHWATVEGKRVSGAQLVAETTLNRARLSKQNLCATVFAPGQFSWTNDGLADGAAHSGLWNKSLELATDLAIKHYEQKRKPLNVTNFYAQAKVTPSWANQYRLVVRVGNHTFLTRS